MYDTPFGSEIGSSPPGWRPKHLKPEPVSRKPNIAFARILKPTTELTLNSLELISRHMQEQGSP